MIKAVESRRATIGLWVVSVLVIVFLVLPSLFVIPFSFSEARFYDFPPKQLSLRWWEEFFADPAWLQSLGNSIVIGLATAAIATVAGTAAALSLVRGRYRGRSATRAFFIVPMYIPVMVLALGFYAIFAKFGIIGSRVGIVLAHSVIAVPVVIVNVSASLQGYNVQLEQAAQALGASPMRAFLRVTLPIIRPGVAGGALFAFLTSFDELVIALFLSGTTAVTLPVQMWQGIRFENNPTIAAAATFLIVLSFLALVSAEIIRRRGERRLGTPSGTLAP
jgi:ABC-type spermidine/putrescine transport system permease subunit II